VYSIVGVESEKKIRINTLKQKKSFTVCGSKLARLYKTYFCSQKPTSLTQISQRAFKKLRNRCAHNSFKSKTILAPLEFLNIKQNNLADKKDWEIYAANVS
jgi:hypothetical protein